MTALAEDPRVEEVAPEEDSDDCPSLVDGVNPAEVFTTNKMLYRKLG